MPGYEPNCETTLGDPNPKKGPPIRCPYCRQFHLRLGYCQALNPVNAALYPQVWADEEAPAVDHPDRAPDGSWVASGEVGDARRRNYARKMGKTDLDPATGKPFDPPLTVLTEAERELGFVVPPGWGDETHESEGAPPGGDPDNLGRNSRKARKTAKSQNLDVTKLQLEGTKLHPDVTDNRKSVRDNLNVTDNWEACGVCGKSFKAKRADAQYCSARCRKRASRG
jgi:hypothetical protein